jgi:hypothetical protein
VASVKDDPLHLRNIPPRHLLNRRDDACEVDQCISLTFVDVIVDLSSLRDLKLQLLERALGLLAHADDGGSIYDRRVHTCRPLISPPVLCGAVGKA